MFEHFGLILLAYREKKFFTADNFVKYKTFLNEKIIIQTETNENFLFFVTLSFRDSLLI